MSSDTPPKSTNPREDRLKAALKANMAKRKAQARARRDAAAQADEQKQAGQTAGTRKD